MNNFNLIGNTIGGRYFDLSLLRPEMRMLSFGIGEDISFELEIENKIDRICCFDPTPKSYNYMMSLGCDKNLYFSYYGIAKERGMVKFYYPKNPDHVSCSIDNLQNTTKYFEAKVFTLSEFIKGYALGNLHILKMDIEGTEYDVIDYMFEWSIYPELLMIEFHHNKPTEPYIQKLLTKYILLHQHGNDYLFKNLFGPYPLKREQN